MSTIEAFNVILAGLRTLTALGYTYEQVQKTILQARAEGREVSTADLDALEVEAVAALRRLEEATREN